MGLERRDRTDQGRLEANPTGEEPREKPRPKVKSFEIPKRLVFEAWEKVRANQGRRAWTLVSIAEFQEREADNLYKLWNRMSSGWYMPGPVRAVEIPKITDWGSGRSGCPTRQTGSPRPRRRCCWKRSWSRSSILTATDTVLGGPPMMPSLAITRGRCWRKDWVLDLDIRAFFDSVPWDLMLKAVAHHTDERWVLLYLERWLKAPIQMPDGTLVAREKGTPQGSPISPLIANLFMHYAFDRWMDRNFPGCPFERYADDVIAHCDSEKQAEELEAAIAERLGTLGLELHPDKTKIVYCKDANRRGNSEHTSFDFLGYSFRGASPEAGTATSWASARP